MLRNPFPAVALALCIAALSLHSFAAPPEKRSSPQQRADSICKEQLQRKGYKIAKVGYPELMRSKTGYSYTGQFSINGKRHEFNCLLNDKLEYEDLVVGPLAS